MLSYKLSITTQNFLNILYWFEERRNTTDNEGSLQKHQQTARITARYLPGWPEVFIKKQKL
jgi:hypothetical protein